MKYYLLFALMLVLLTECNSQIVSKSICAKYRINDSDYFIVKFTINNSLNEPIMIWLHSPDKFHEIRKYFSLTKDDYSLSTIIYEGLLQSTGMIVGKNFLKVLPRDKTFDVYIYSDKPITDVSTLENCIAVVRQSQVQSIYNFNLKFLNTFNEDYIILNESELLQIK